MRGREVLCISYSTCYTPNVVPRGAPSKVTARNWSSGQSQNQAARELGAEATTVSAQYQLAHLAESRWAVTRNIRVVSSDAWHYDATLPGMTQTLTWEFLMATEVIVAKFGGTSMKDAAAMRQAAKIAVSTNANIVVVSATAGTTDELLQLAKSAINQTWNECQAVIDHILNRHLEIASDLKASAIVRKHITQLVDELTTIAHGIHLTKECSQKTLDSFVGTGEQLSSHLMHSALIEAGASSARYLDARAVIKTDDRYEQATPDITLTAAAAKTAKLRKHIEDGVVYITQGFIGQAGDGSTTTLGRGGSDYSAALFAEAINADKLYIWTDVAGIATTDPRITPNARTIKNISYYEATEMATGGAKIIYPRTLLPTHRKNIPVFVGSTFEPEKSGTWIRPRSADAPLVRAITLKQNQGLITLTTPRMVEAYGFLANVFALFTKHRISVDQVTTSEVAVAISAANATLEHTELLEELRQLGEVSIERNLSVVSLIGNNVHLTPGLTQSIFNALQNGDSTISIRMVCQGASVHSIALVIPDKQATEAVKRLHKHFIEEGRAS